MKLTSLHIDTYHRAACNSAAAGGSGRTRCRSNPPKDVHETRRGAGFSFKATREIDPALLAGRQCAPRTRRIVVTVQRPNKIAADSTSKDGVRHFYADGTKSVAGLM